MELHELKNKKMPYLSGGEKQRAKIATLLIQNPQIYLLDEPTNHLDLHYQVKILKHFAYLKTSQQKSIVMTLHDINLAAQYCDQILMLFPNGKTLYGKSEEILCEENLSLLYGHPIHKLHPHGFAPSY
jgi:iron complex transport system ATP-binding protein